jgi:hypothetical protein
VLSESSTMRLASQKALFSCSHRIRWGRSSARRYLLFRQISAQRLGVRRACDDR